MAGPFGDIHVRVGRGLVEHVPKFSPRGRMLLPTLTTGIVSAPSPAWNGWVQFAVPG
jgi:hypothetical protein